MHPKLIGMPYGPSPSMLYRKGALFHRPVAALRPMIVMVDARLCAQGKGDEKIKYLFELLTEELIQAHLYSSEGPPERAQRVTALATGVEGIEDWVDVRTGTSDERLEVVYLKDGIPTAVQIQTADPIFLHLSQALLPDQDPSSDLADQMRAEALALLIAKTIRADIFITDRQWRVETESQFWRTTTVMQPEDALPVVGLYLRQQGRFVLARSPTLGAPAGRQSLTDRNSTTFYWEVARNLIPATARLKSASRARETATGDETLLSLTTAMTWRVEQVLRSRDGLLATLSVVPQSHGPADKILTDLDAILLWLMAAFDILAFVTHLVLHIPTPGRKPAWQDTKWLKKVAVQDEALADLMRKGNDGEHLLTIVKELRNTIHGEALSAEGTIPVVGQDALTPLFRLPQRNRDDVLQAIDALSGRAAWGIRRPFPDYDLHVHPGEFLEQLLPRTISLFNQVLIAMPVERISGMDAKPNHILGARPQSLLNYRGVWQLGL